MNVKAQCPNASVWASHAMVASGHPLASQAGLQMLHQGGNAVDAAIAMAFATGVLMPDMAGLGGEAFVLYQAPHREITAYLGSGRLPQGYDESKLPKSLTLPLHQGASVSVPGALDLYWRLHQDGGRLPWARVIEPAQRLAEEGFPVDARLAESLQEMTVLQEEAPSCQDVFFPQGQPLVEGELLKQPALANTLKLLQEQGRDGFYRGEVAHDIVKAVTRAGGFLDDDDLRAHETETTKPLSLSFGPYTIYQTPPPSQGVVMLEALAMLGPDFPKDWRQTGANVHQVIESLRWAFYDRREYLGDPLWQHFDPTQLLTEQWIEKRRAGILPRASSIDTTLKEGDTTSLLAVDDEGHVVSFIHSLALSFGSYVFVPERGFFLNNRAGRSFNRIVGHPNQATPGKRPMHTLNTYMVTYGDQFYLAGNTPGGDGQPQWNLMILLDLLQAQALPHEAVSAPRLTIGPATDAHTLSQQSYVALESRFAPHVIDDLRKRGHNVRVIGPLSGGGSAQVIMRRLGNWVGASDPRGIGQTLGY
ncbi:gamma-glutamyltransferase family protein [Sulfobacillus thermosulfidooxidans]|uniref:gamma-glutamyltransferase family protein n=1 Tax=Sulfobacillus thermosulfidooxidans TaxID=28034 RepID=UPI00096BA2BF|nr:gamma-glutamyltransferase family protein [Sulfobacillus thermosulfidooxidans]OLZ11141.1 gamma-glutamyltranspeptidase [Sulfobacillus thermosulfidooxidans]OLZ14124.1 gamma-glutamyltranspeptidase [Sulfobacillus thermosulfidooxidans]OLZ18868.1 gamma-glutamyltranspeptidase [Sulfobacillus thermosulfidooxidans]